MDAPDFVTVGGADSATDLGISPKSGHADHLSEKIAAVPNLTIASNFKTKKELPEIKASAAGFDFDPTRRFVRELAKRSDYRCVLIHPILHNPAFSAVAVSFLCLASRTSDWPAVLSKICYQLAELQLWRVRMHFFSF